MSKKASIMCTILYAIGVFAVVYVATIITGSNGVSLWMIIGSIYTSYRIGFSIPEFYHRIRNSKA